MVLRGPTARCATSARRLEGNCLRPALLCLPLAALIMLVFASVTIMLSGPSALAQDSEQTLTDPVVTEPVPTNTVPAGANKPMLLQADELVYDNQGNRVIAQGNVEIYYNGFALLADKVTYDRGANTLAAEGNVRIKEPDGAVINADQITLTEDFRDGFISSLKIVTKDDIRIAANQATREDAETTVFEEGVFTACKPCADNPQAPPFWRVRAARIIHKKSEGNIYFEDAYLDFFGQPFVYVPFFYTPDPSVKRRSGFLTPSAGFSEDLGFTAEVPYFWAIAPNMDLTFSPQALTRRGVLVKAIWRHRLANGTYKFDMSGIYETEERDSTGTPWAGSVVSEGDFKLNSWWNFGWNATLESDDGFRRFYKLDNVLTTDRVSEAHLVGQSVRNYFGLYLYHFGGLLLTDNQESESSALPSFDYHYIVDAPVIGGELSFDANAVVLSRNKLDPIGAGRPVSRKHSRLVAQANWRKQIIDGIGEVFTPFAYGRGDVYHIDEFADPDTPLVPPEDVSVTRATGAVGLQYQFPFVSHSSYGSHVIEPVAQIIARPETIETGKIPNEDAQSFVFDDTLLFDLDKFSGYDRIETGTRANVGLQYTLQANNGGYVRGVVGQSYQVSGGNPFDAGSGLDRTASDYVMGLYFAPTNNLRFVSQSRFDAENFELLREDLSAFASYGPFAVGASYAFDRSVDGLGVRRDDQEVQGTASVQLSQNWSAFGSLRYDIDDLQTVTDSLGVKWANDCASLSVIYSESNITDQDITPDRTLMFRLELSHLGAATVTTDAFGSTVASEDR